MSPPRYFPFPDSGPPIPVDGGIKARSKRGAIGEQWWSRRFIAFLESSGMSGRLQRGRSYARRGQVLECFRVSQKPVLIWTMPTQNVFFIAQDKARGATIKAILHWWSRVVYI